MADLNFSYIARGARWFLMRVVVRAIDLPFALMGYLPGDPRSGWKSAVIGVTADVLVPLMRLNKWLYQLEVTNERQH